MSRNFIDYYRCSSESVNFEIRPGACDEIGYFRLGSELTCYGKTTAVPLGKGACDELADVLPAIGVESGKVRLPFDPDLTSDLLRFERYPVELSKDSEQRLGARPVVRDLYYVFRPLMPVRVRSVLQRAHLRGQLTSPFPNWPVDRTVDQLFTKMMELALRANGNDPIPFVWFWPEGKRAAFILTHDVESPAGVAFTPRLMDLDSEFGFRASFQVVPEKRYDVTDSFLDTIRSRGFEVNIHDLNHDGNLYQDHEEFQRRAAKINQYAKEFQTRGFRSGALYRRLDWYERFDISYDMSVPNVAHLDPQSGGCCTVMPYFIGNIVELPVTETQDYSLFHILKQYSINLWKEQSNIIIKGNGMISLIAHPDYLIARKARNTYRQLLGYLTDTCRGQNVWATLPSEIDCWWRLRHKMRPVHVGNTWHVQGHGCERARIAYARLVDGKLEYILAPPPTDRNAAYIVGASDPNDCEVLASHAKALETSNVRLPGAATSIQMEVQTVDLVRGAAISECAVSNVRFEAQPTDAKSELCMPTIEQRHEASGASELVVKTRRFSEPLRVCMVAYTFYEADNRVMRYAETLAQEGHDVEVFALKQGNNPKEEIICGVKVHRLQTRVINEKGQFSYAWRILLFLLRAFYQVSKNDLRRKYHFVHVHSVPDFLVFCALLPRLRGIPVVLDIHDILPEFYLGKFGGGKESLAFRFLTFVERTCANFASHVIIANDIWKERLIGRSVSASRCSVVLNYPDRTIFHVSDTAGSRSDRFLLLYPGTLNWHQGLDIAVRAFAKICNQVPYADFHIYGEGPARPLLTDLIKELGLEGRVVLQETRRIREIARIMQTADLGIVPKRKDNFGNEAFSTKIFEFMAMGVPVIVSDTRIDRYYFNDSLVRFFQGGNEDDLAGCMLDLIEHPEKRRKFVENANSFIRKNGWEVKKQEYLDLVDRLIGMEKAAGSTVVVRS